MCKRVWNLKFAGVLAACALGAVALRVAWATPSLGFTGVGIVGPVLLDEINTKSESDDRIQIKSKGFTDVYVTDVTITPGGHSGWHSHPGPSIVTIKSGEATLYDDCDDPTVPHVYPAGTGFVEDAGCVHLVRNEGNVDLKIVLVQIVPFGAPKRIDEPAPTPKPHLPLHPGPSILTSRWPLAVLFQPGGRNLRPPRAAGPRTKSRSGGGGN